MENLFWAFKDDHIFNFVTDIDSFVYYTKDIKSKNNYIYEFKSRPTAVAASLTTRIRVVTLYNYNN